ncbi:uncharacterized protein LOC114480684 [Gouania willdenowi]|uniref:uncharacterized protein LOC114480684 n=1 Tax=Gouania willdenowi TaxID=441366 RepID=UPI0010551D71|nr:uncharacterized protein LOC114480684 [Gouania willdenowi]
MFSPDPTIGNGRMIPNSLGHLRLNAQSPPDSFRTEIDPMRHLSTMTSRRIEVQLTQEEDQALTNLLKLHYEEDCFSQGVEPQPDWTPDPILYSCFCENLAEAFRGSDGEFAIPDMIFSPFDQDEASLHCDPLLHGGTRIQEAAEIFLALFGANFTNKTSPPTDQSPCSVSDKYGEAVLDDTSHFGDFLERRVQKLSELEVNAVKMLLRLSNAAQ